MLHLHAFSGARGQPFPNDTTLISLYLFRIPMAWYLSGNTGVNGIWWSEPIGWFAGMIILIIYYLSGKWKGKEVARRLLPSEE